MTAVDLFDRLMSHSYTLVIHLYALKHPKKLLYIEIWFSGHFEFMQIRALEVGNFGETFYTSPLFVGGAIHTHFI